MSFVHSLYVGRAWSAALSVLAALMAFVVTTPAWGQSTGTLIQWGDTSGGQATGLPASSERFTVTSAGYFHAVGLRADGSLVQWGDATARQTVGAPVSTERFVAVSCGAYHTLALRADGSLVQWGDTTANQLIGAPVSTARFSAISAGAFHSIGLRTDGTIVQWGQTSANQANSLPLVTGQFSAIAAGSYHGLALRADGSWIQWGDASRGQVNSLPVTTARFTKIVAGFAHNLALRTDGSLLQWGDTSFSQTLNAPLASERFVKLAAGIGHSLGLRADGSLVQWGQTALGQGTNVPAVTERFIGIACGWLNSHALRGPPGVARSFVYQGQLTGIAGAADVRLSLFDAETGGRQVGQVFTTTGVSVSPSGVVSVLASFGIIDLSQELWLNIEVTQSGGPPLTALTPRTYLTMSPKAGYAKSAGTAAFATESSLATTAINAQQSVWTGISGVPANVTNAFSPWNAITGGIGYGLGNVTIGSSALAAPFKLRVLGDISCVSLTQTSSARYKDDVKPLSLGLDALLELRPVTFVWNDQAAEDVRGRRDVGLLAEEVAKLMPQAVTFDANGRAQGIDYSRITVLAVNAIREQQQTIDSLKAENAANASRIRDLEAKLDKLAEVVKGR